MKRGKVSFAGLLLVFSTLLFETVNAEPVINESYDIINSPNCFSENPTGWAWLPHCLVDTYQGITHYSGEISSPGRGGSGKSLKLWRHKGFWALGYTGYLNPKDFDWSMQKYRELYFRYYLRWPKGLSVPTGVGTKFNRAYAGSTQGARTGEVSLIAEGSLGDSGCFMLYLPGMSAKPDIFRTAKFSTLGINDGKWHCIEVHVKFNSECKSDGVVGIFIDGKAKSLGYYVGATYYYTGNGNEFTSLSGIPSNIYYTMALAPGIGNTGGGASPYVINPDQWMAMEFDDYVVSTTYVGPRKDITPLNPVQGVKAIK